MLDEELRGRLREEAERAEAGATSSVDPRALARRMAEELHREKARKRAFAATAFVCAAAGVAFFAGRMTAPVEEIAEHAPARCASVRVDARALAEVAGADRRDVDSRFRFATDAQARLHVDARRPCASVLTLATGAVDVWARGLEGGALHVQAGDVRVEVKGTRFRVVREATAVSVHVAEGRVHVHARSLPVVVLTAGQSARIDQGVTRSALPADVREALDALLADASARQAALPAAPPQETVAAPVVRDTATASGAQEDPVPSDALVLEAERAMREGRLDDARALFKRAGRAQTATGEAAWIRLARLELRAGRAREARRAIAEHDARFRGGRLAAEALYVDALAARGMGDEAAAARAESALLERFSESPQAARVRAARGE